MATKPYQKDGKWWIDVDPEDKNYIVWNVTNDLTDRATTATSVECVPGAVTVLEGPAIQGSLIVAKIAMDTSGPNTPHFCTARVTCANSERFDRTIWFNLEDH